MGVGVAWLLLCVGIVTALAQETPPPEPTVSAIKPVTTPTIDRLAAPPTVIPPTQADDGAQLYWLWCQPCHGDRGQGLTDEWREQYPEEDQYCWNRFCHGNIPYEDGFTLPEHVPALIGGQSLARFQTMEELYEYTRFKMPFEYPGALNEEGALAVTAYLARAHGKWDGTRLTVDNVSQLRWQPLPTPTPVYAPVEAAIDDIASSTGLTPTAVVFLAGGMLLLLTLLGGVTIWRRRH